MNKDKQKEAEERWCKMVGLEPTEFNRMLAPVIAEEWTHDTHPSTI